MRELLGQALAIVPSSAKLGAMGASIDIPIHHKDAAMSAAISTRSRQRAGRAARRRDHVRAGDDDGRPAARAGRRAAGVGDFQVGRAAMRRFPLPPCGGAAGRGER